MAAVGLVKKEIPNGTIRATSTTAMINERIKDIFVNSKWCLARLSLRMVISS
jgi:hypothetical protein